MEWLERLENRVTHLFARASDPVLAEVRAAFQVARIECQWEQQGDILNISVTDIRPQDAVDTFKLQYDTKPDQVWALEPHERRGIPEHLRPMLDDYAEAIGESDENQATIGDRLDLILLSTLAAHKREQFGPYQQESLHWRYENHIEFPWVYRGKPRLISGKAEYTLSCASPDSNLVIVKVPRQGLNGEHQVLSYLAMIYHSRKKAGKPNTAMYGIATDTYTWCFIRFDHGAKVSTRRFSWLEGQQVEIVSNLQKIMSITGGSLGRTNTQMSLVRRYGDEEVD